MDPKLSSAPKPYLFTYQFQDASQKILKEQSPALLKGKLDTLRNLYNQKLEEFKAINKPDNQK